MLSNEELLNLANEIGEMIRKIGVDGYAISLHSTLSRQVRFAANKISVTKTWDETEISVLIDKNERVAAFSIGLPSKDRIPDLTKRSLEAIKSAPPRKDYTPLPKPANNYPSPPAGIDQALREDPEKLLDIAKEAIDSGLSEGAKKMAGTIIANVSNSVLITSAGFKGDLSLSNIYLDVRAFTSKEATGHASIASRTLSDIKASDIAFLAARDAKISQNLKSIPSGKYNTVFTIDATASLMNLVGGSASAYAVDSGFSFLINKLGNSIAPEKLILEDNPLLKNGFIIRTFDDEGVPTRVINIINKGVLENYLHNRFTAKKFSTEHNAHAGWLLPHAWELVIYPGEANWDELLEIINKGLIVSNATYIRYQNYIAGTFSAVIRDGVFYVENGEIKHAVKGLRLSDSMPNILSNILEIGKDRRQVYHWWLESGIPVLSAPIAVRDVNYTKAFS